MTKLIYTHKTPCGVFEVYDDKPQLEFAHCHQVHEAKVVHSLCASKEIKADGVFNSSEERKILAVVTADCLPIAICGKNGNAMIHAGWRGLHKQILLADELIKIDPFYAFIGPHISLQNYEVSLDFRDNFPNREKSFSMIAEKLHFSLEIEAILQLQEAYQSIKIESANICTYNNLNFHSYRREQSALRNWNLLRTN